MNPYLHLPLVEPFLATRFDTKDLCPSSSSGQEIFDKSAVERQLRNQLDWIEEEADFRAPFPEIPLRFISSPIQHVSTIFRNSTILPDHQLSA